MYTYSEYEGRRVVVNGDVIKVINGVPSADDAVRITIIML